MMERDKMRIRQGVGERWVETSEGRMRVGRPFEKWRWLMVRMRPKWIERKIMRTIKYLKKKERASREASTCWCLELVRSCCNILDTKCASSFYKCCICWSHSGTLTPRDFQKSCWNAAEMLLKCCSFLTHICFCLFVILRVWEFKRGKGTFWRFCKTRAERIMPSPHFGVQVCNRAEQKKKKKTSPGDVFFFSP